MFHLLTRQRGRSPERELFCSVLLQAFLDATGNAHANGRNNPLTTAVQAGVRYWLLNDNIDFPEVCEYAGFDASAVRRAARRLEATDWVRPRELRPLNAPRVT